MRSFLGVPILVRAMPFGNLYLTEKQGGLFTEEDQEAVVLLAGQAAVVIEHARMVEAVAALVTSIGGAGRGVGRVQPRA